MDINTTPGQDYDIAVSMNDNLNSFQGEIKIYSIQFPIFIVRAIF